MTRRSRAELRQLVIDAGCELLAERGLAFDPPHLTYANVFQHLRETRGVTLHRSQVHGRIWDSQEHYRIDVALTLIEHTATPGSAEVDELVERLNATDQSARVRHLADAWAASSIETSRSRADLDPSFDILVAAQALATTGAATPFEIGEAAGGNLRRRTSHNEQRYENAARGLGVDISAEFDMAPADAWATLARTSSALLEGSRLVEALLPEFRAPYPVTDDEGNPQHRDLATLGLCLMVEQLLGIDDDRADDPDPDAAHEA